MRRNNIIENIKSSILIAYRYLISVEVIDQIDQFEIQSCKYNIRSILKNDYYVPIKNIIKCIIMKINENKYKIATFNGIINSQISYNSPVMNISSISQNNKTNYYIPSPPVHNDQALNFNKTNINVTVSPINTMNKINTIGHSR
ncbi:hypothetical protein H8356DRAFT_1324498 [Neocallimastix lanati (nom. inval.)]|nr:hypothetical protein H8356DRAFT_1324498 [Neocallimastix sp. JGI-2020a]